ncbi:hypothetical protein F5X96DRAFT_640667 [Biscogniauxia mediterranea]|nr:hypothetical protein F5X96DRAFT_640667 [Biscogniauxia mediterranea]
MVQREDIHDIDLSIRFKHGKQTIFLFVDAQKPFSEIQEELLDVLRERYPEGLATLSSPQKTELPDEPSRIVFAVPKAPADLSQGWKPLNVGEDDTPASRNLKDNSVVAFAIRPEDADGEEEISFDVDLPSWEDEYAEAEEQQ